MRNNIVYFKIIMTEHCHQSQISSQNLGSSNHTHTHTHTHKYVHTQTHSSINYQSILTMLKVI